MNARSLAMQFEGLELNAYIDIAGVWTCGYGHTGKDVYEGVIWTQPQAEEALDSDLAEARHLLNLYSPNLINPGAIEALTDWIFNLGVGNYRSSSLRILVNGCNWPAVKSALLEWDHSGGRVIPGLLRRRQAEADLIV